MSEQHDQQDSTGFWLNVSGVYCTLSESLELVRTLTSLQARCHALQRRVQNYLAAERVYYSQQEPIRATQEEARENIMRLLCSRTQNIDKQGNATYIPPFKSPTAVGILRRCSKFSATGVPSRTCPSFMLHASTASQESVVAQSTRINSLEHNVSETVDECTNRESANTAVTS